MENFSAKWCEDTLKTYLTKGTKELLGSDRDVPYLREVKEEDVRSLYYVLNVWTFMFQDVTQVDTLVDYIKRNGPIEVIREAEQLRLDFIQNGCSTNLFTSGTPWVFLRTKDPYTCIQVLGYPRRLYITGSNLEVITRDNFIKNNRRMKNPIQFYHYEVMTNPYYDAFDSKYCNVDVLGQRHNLRLEKFIIGIRHELRKLFKGYKKNLDCFKLPSGSTFEGKEAYVDKFEILSSNKSWVIEATGWRKDLFTASDLDVPPKMVNRLICVPKSWKTHRTVCPEELSRQVVGYTIASSMRKCLFRNTSSYKRVVKYKIPAYDGYDFIFEEDERCTTFGQIDLRDQSQNQELAQFGSATDLVATVDFSAASDSISKQLCKLVLPKRLHDDLLSVRAERCIVYPKQAPMWLNTFMTMGHGCTFDLETSIFRSGAVVAVKDTWCYLDQETKDYYGGKLSNAISFCVAYGDDVIIPSFACDYFCMRMSQLGFIPNMDKTYQEGPYRESCGKEYFLGHDISVSAWPRGTSNSEFAELLSQQHKLLDYPRANAFLIERIHQLHPSVQQNDVGSPWYDIWLHGYQPEIRQVPLYAHKYQTLTLIDKDGVEHSYHISEWNEQDRTFSYKGFYYKLILHWFQEGDDLVLGGLCSRIQKTISPTKGNGPIDEYRFTRYAISNYENRGIVDARDVEPYIFATVGSSETKTENDITRRQKADDLAYMLELARLARIPKDDVDLSDTTLLDSYDYKKDNVILQGDRRIDSLCNPSRNKYKKKIVHI